MTVHLPDDLERRVRAAVDRGRFASVDDAMAEAARLLLRELERGQPQAELADDASRSGLGSIGAMRAAADELDEIVADAYLNFRRF
jgi:Arc/MetJ-type ribon-helix-helix transcriptional regulator